MYDLAIIGGGPAGVAAGIYAARKRLKSILITEAIGGQSIDSVEIQNWIGTQKISGLDLAKSFEAHLKAHAAGIVDIKLPARAQRVEAGKNVFIIHTSQGTFEARAVLLTTGGVRRKLSIPGAAEFENKGVTYCASCDGPLFAGQDVVVVGGGNAGFETAAQLLAYAKSVTLVHRGGEFSKADKTTVDAVLAHANFTALINSTPVEIKGGGANGPNFVGSLAVKDNSTGAVQELAVTGIFVEVGMLPATDAVVGLVELDPYGRVVVNAKNQRTSLEGVWAAGDCTDELYHQNNIAAGDGVKALEDIYFWVKAKK